MPLGGIEGKEPRSWWVARRRRMGSQKTLSFAAMIHKLRLLRLPNLFIIVCTVVAVQVYLSRTMESSAFGLESAILTGVAISLVAAAGYVFNDIEDQEADELNNPEARMIGKHVDEAEAQKLAIWCIIGSGLISGALVSYHQLYWPILLLPVGGLLLLVYNKLAQYWPLVGNLIVALLCASVIFLAQELYFSLMPGIERTWSLTGNHTRPVVFLGAFAFVLSVYREIMKDLEDLEGDRHVGASTVAIALGEAPARIMAAAMMLSIIVMLGALAWWLIQDSRSILALFLVSFILVPLIIAFVYGAWGRTRFEYGKASMWSKHAMFMGLVFLVVLGVV